MNPTSALLGLVLVASSGVAQSQLRPDLDLNIKQKEASAKLGLEFGRDADVDDGTSIEAYVRIPAKRSDETNTGELEVGSSPWLLGGTVRFIRDLTTEDGEVQLLNLGVSAEWGFQRFAWQPLGSEATLERTRHSLKARFDALYYRFSPAAKHPLRRVVPQLSATYEREFSARDEVAFVSEPEANPPRVTSRVTEAPAATPVLGIRGTIIFGITGGEHPLALGPSYLLSLRGEEGQTLRFAASTAHTVACWLYYMPTDDSTLGVRLGVAPTLSFEPGSDPEVGAVFGVRVGGVSYQY